MSEVKPATTILSARHLGQLLLMQSVLESLPDEKSIHNFVARGLSELPGVTEVTFRDASGESPGRDTLRFPLQVGEARKGELLVTCNDRSAFQPYEGYIRNFCFMVAVILEERLQRQIRESHLITLEHEVQERTRQLQSQVAERSRTEQQVRALLLEAERARNALLGILEDQRQAEESLRESEERHRTILRTAMDGFWRADPQGRLLEVNEAYCRMSGYSEQELLAMRISDLEAAETHVDVAAHIQEIMAQTEDRFETRHRRKDGSTYAVEVSVQYKLAEGAQMVAFLRDLTARKEAEDDFQRTQLQLAHMGRLTTAGELVAGIAHEVNQPLYAIANFAKACSNVLAQDKPPLDKVCQWNEEISAAAVRAGEIIKRLRFFLGRSKTQRLSAGIREIIDESVALVAFETRRLGVTVRRQLGDANPEVVVDRVQIQQVLVNLVQNACEALEEKTTGPRQLTIRAAAAGDFVEVSIADNGPGLKDPDASNIFDPFVTTKPAGLGMGLAISRSIVEAHGGRIWASKNPEGGATFHFTLPVARGGQNDVR